MEKSTNENEKKLEGFLQGEQNKERIYNQLIDSENSGVQCENKSIDTRPVVVAQTTPLPLPNLFHFHK